MQNPTIIIRQTGGTEVLEYVDNAIPSPKANEILICQTAIGVNYIDTYFRKGLYPIANFPTILGSEGAGIIEAIGENVTGFKIGDRICYTGGFGAYCKYRTIKANDAILIPEGINDEQAAACLLKGLTAQYLLRRTFKVTKENSVFYHAAAGGVGLIFGQWAKHLGARVIGTAGSEEKCDLARHHGFDEVINYREKDFVKPAIDLNFGQKYDVVYDSVGKDTFYKSLDIIKPMGLMVSFGQSSGPIQPLDIGILNQKGSLFLTRPNLFAYNSTREILLESVGELFDLIARGIIKIEINQRFALKDIAMAHDALEGRQTTGTTILIP